MLRWALGFVVLAVISAFLAFGGVAAGATGIARIMFYGFLILASIALLNAVLERRTKV